MGYYHHLHSLTIREWKVVAKVISTNNEESGESTAVFRTPEIKVRRVSRTTIMD